MPEEIKLSKFDSQPWGFRLVGGKDFATALTVSKVTVGSLAEAAGMRVGDVLVALNDNPLHNLTHWEAHEAIIHAGNNFVLSVVRSPQQSTPAAASAPISTQFLVHHIPKNQPGNPPAMQMFGQQMQKQPNMLQQQMFGQQIIQELSNTLQQTPVNLSVEEQFDMLYQDGQSRNTKTAQDLSQPMNPQGIPHLEKPVAIGGNKQGSNMYQYTSQQEANVKITSVEARENIDHYLHQGNNLQQMYPGQQWIQQDQFEMQQVVQPLSPFQQQQYSNTSQQQPQSLLTYHQVMPPEMFTEDYIAEIMSGNAEVIMGNAIGVNFNKFKIEPKIDHLCSSGVMQLLQEEKAMREAMK